MVKLYLCKFDGGGGHVKALFDNEVTFLSNLQVLVLDGRGHLLGRLSAIVAKQLLLGKFSMKTSKHNVRYHLSSEFSSKLGDCCMSVSDDFFVSCLSLATMRKLTCTTI